jgi:hypothetical protein
MGRKAMQPARIMLSRPGKDASDFVRMFSSSFTAIGNIWGHARSGVSAGPCMAPDLTSLRQGCGSAAQPQSNART